MEYGNTEYSKTAQALLLRKDEEGFLEILTKTLRSVHDRGFSEGVKININKL